MMNKIDYKYTDLLNDILTNGTSKETRNGGTISVFGRQIRHDMTEGFPLLTTKKMAWKSMLNELLWFLRGETNIKPLTEKGCNIWNGDAYKNYVTEFNKGNASGQTQLVNRIGEENVDIILSEEDFIDMIKNCDELGCRDFMLKWGDLGPIYGSQWRSWRVGKGIETTLKTEDGQTLYESGSMYIDQIKNLINELKTNPDSRRLMVNAWNVGELDQMVLPPCHYGFQVYTRELTEGEMWDYTHNNDIHIEHSDAILYAHEKGSELRESFIPMLKEKYGIPSRGISLMWNQRSVDTFLGLPFNISSYGLLLQIIAQHVNMVPLELIGNLGDVHLYSNHVDQAKEQIGRNLSLDERIALKPDYLDIIDVNDIECDSDMNPQWFIDQAKAKESYCSYPSKTKVLDTLNVPKRTRESFQLPKVKIKPFEELEELTFDHFELVGYESHPRIKAPLSN
jgi:thymidylate synthase